MQDLRIRKMQVHLINPENPLILKFLIQQLGVLHVELVAKNDVAEFDRVGEESVFS